MLNQTITLKDGRKLGYNIYGDKDGIPVFVFHGTPGSRIWFLENDEEATRLGIRLIATDRPGYGLSDFHANRTIIDYANDIKELVDFLHLPKFSVLGVSGGGPFALAVAHKYSDAVLNCILVSSATPFTNGKAPKTMSKSNRIAFYLSNHLPWLMKLSMNSQKKLLDTNKEKYIQLLIKSSETLPNWDKVQLLKPHNLEASFYHAKEAFHQGIEGALFETQLLSKEWNIPLENINVPIAIWHGEEDSHSPITEMKKLATSFASVQTHYIENAGHFLCDDDQIWSEILHTLKGTSN